MSRKVTEIPFAVGSDGSVYVNVAHWQRVAPRALVDRALHQDGEILIAVRASTSEARQILARVQDGAHEAIALTIAARERRARRKRDTPKSPL
jgi:hypothetical protein